MADFRVFSNASAQIAGKLITVATSILLLKILTNYLTIEEYGLYGKVYNYLSIFAVIADTGLYTMAIREISACRDDPEKAEKIFGNIFAIRAIFGIVAVFLALGIAAFLPGYDSTLALAAVAFAGVFTFFGIINSSLLSLLQAYQRSEFSLVSTSIGKIANLLSILLIVFVLVPAATLDAHPEWRLWVFLAIMGAGLLGNVIMTTLTALYTLPRYRIRIGLDSRYIVDLLRRAAPYGLALFLGVVYFKVDIIMLSILEPRAIADVSVALYSVPMKIVEVGMMVSTLFLNSLLPVLTRHVEGDDAPGFARTFRRASLVLVFGALFLSACVFAFGREILIVLSNTAYIDDTLYTFTSLDAFHIAGGVFIVAFLGQLATFGLVAHGVQSRLLALNFLLALVNIVGNFFLIPVFSFL